MRRFLLPEIALGFLFASALWGAISLLIADPATYRQICEYDQYGHAHCAARNLLSVALWYLGYVINAATISALATVFIAWFTWTLRQSTEKMWTETKKAAEAADLSAKAVTVVERAYVYPVVLGHGPIALCIASAYAITKDDVPSSETAEITYRFKNFGKTPAILKAASVGFGVAPLGALIGVSITESVLASLEETGELIIGMWIGITRKQAERIFADTGHVCFEGRVTFDDIWGNEHTTEFSFVWDKGIQRMALRSVSTKTKHKGEEPIE